MLNLKTILPMIMIAVSGCSHDYETSYQELNTGTGFDVECIVNTLSYSTATSDMERLTNGAVLTYNAYPMLVLHDKDVNISSTLSVFGSSGVKKLKDQNITEEIANRLNSKCRVPAQSSDGKSVSRNHSGTHVRFSLQPWNPSWKISYPDK